MPNEIETVWKMYTTVFGAGDEAVTLLDNGKVMEAKEKLQKALRAAEELYVSGEPEKN